MNDLADSVDAGFAEGWRPEEGDKLVGKIVGLARGWSDQSESFYPIITIHDETLDKDVAVHCFHYVLKNRVTDLKPKIDERIGIKYDGTVPTKDGKRTVAKYIVRVEGRDVDIWSQEAPPQQTAPVNSPGSGGDDTSLEQNAGESDDDDIPF